MINIINTTETAIAVFVSLSIFYFLEKINKIIIIYFLNRTYYLFIKKMYTSFSEQIAIWVKKSLECPIDPQWGMSEKISEMIAYSLK